MSYGTLQIEKMTTESGYSLGAGNASSFKNRIINGDMRIDQRNAGAAVTVNTFDIFSVDRFNLETGGATGGGVYTGQRSTVAPAGFTNSLLCTITTTDTTLAAADLSQVCQYIEGSNITDLNFGTADAKSVTLSFWVRSSVTGNYSVGFQNASVTRSYVGLYTINAANTWEYKTITVPGDTTGTWLTTNGRGLTIRWCFATGSNRVASSANTWSTGNFIAVSGTNNPLMGTSGATFYLTGVQLEVGTVATSFDYRSYGTELALCQRYFETSYEAGNAVGSTANPTRSVVWFAQSTQNYNNQRVDFSVVKRAAPTMAIYNPSTGTVNQIRNLDSNVDYSAGSSGSSTTGFFGYVNNVTVGTSVSLGFHYTASAEL